MQQPQSSQPIRTPFAPAVLYKAGVPFEDVMWFHTLPQSAKMRAVRRTSRGQEILSRVRRFMTEGQQPSMSPAH